MNNAPHAHADAGTDHTSPSRTPRLRGSLFALLAAVMAALVVLASCSGGTPDEEATPTPTYPYVERPSNLIWESGVFGHDVSITQGFAEMRDRPLDVLGVSPTRGTWSDTFSSWWLSDDTIPPGFEGTLNVSVQLFPEDGSLEATAAGDYDTEFERLGAMIAERFPDAYVRPGWEFNIPDWPWAATPENVGVWKEAFRKASIALKRGGPELRIVWNPNEGKGASLPDAATAWPGDDVVDIVGLDAYDWHPPYDAKGWETHRTKDQGWDYWGNFARQHGKKFAVPEWGVIPGNDDSGGDNPDYINYVVQWMVDNWDIMTFENYFEEEDDYCQCALSMNPKARDAYLAWMPKLTQVKPTPDPSAQSTAEPTAGSTATDGEQPAVIEPSGATPSTE